MKLYVQLSGRLGNHLFQVANGLALSKKYNCELFLVYNQHSQQEKEHLEILKQKSVPRHTLSFFNCKMVNDSHDSFSYTPITLTRDTYLYGYYQNEKYFKEIYTHLYDTFIDTKRIDVLKKLYNENSYFIHIRRTDYLVEVRFLIDYSYFERAVGYILERDPDAHFYILSDDIPFCKDYNVIQNLKNKTFIENMNTVTTLHLMTMCSKGGICSNSSFSWWGSYLNKNPDKIVIFPREWINNGMKVDVWYEGSVIL
jgi:hypothetical protein